MCLARCVGGRPCCGRVRLVKQHAGSLTPARAVGLCTMTTACASAPAPRRPASRWPTPSPTRGLPAPGRCHAATHTRPCGAPPRRAQHLLLSPLPACAVRPRGFPSIHAAPLPSPLPAQAAPRRQVAAPKGGQQGVCGGRLGRLCRRQPAALCGHALCGADRAQRPGLPPVCHHSRGLTLHAGHPRLHRHRRGRGRRAGRCAAAVAPCHLCGWTSAVALHAAAAQPGRLARPCPAATHPAPTYLLPSPPPPQATRSSSCLVPGRSPSRCRSCVRSGPPPP